MKAGDRWGKLTLVELVPGRYEKRPDGGKRRIGAAWKCKCDCGKETLARADNIDAGRTRSCGCGRRMNNNQFFTRK